MSDIKISILIPTYNQENYISKALHSALNQITNFEFEILIGDDCSTDDTLLICKDFQSKYPNKIKLISRKVNLGLIGNYIDLINKSKGIYIAILEGDDYWIDNYKIQSQYEFLEKNADYGLVHTNSYHYNTDNESKIEYLKYDKTSFSGNIYYDLLDKNFITAITICFRAQLLKQSLKKELEIVKSFKTIDYYILLTISKISKVGHINKVMALYRVHQNSISNTKDFQKNLEFLNSTFRIKNFFISKHENNKALKEQSINQYYKKVFMLSLKYEPYDDYNTINFDSTYKNIMIKGYFRIKGLRFVCKLLYRVFN